MCDFLCSDGLYVSTIYCRFLKNHIHIRLTRFPTCVFHSKTPCESGCWLIETSLEFRPVYVKSAFRRRTQMNTICILMSHLNMSISYCLGLDWSRRMILFLWVLHILIIILLIGNVPEDGNLFASNFIIILGRLRRWICFLRWRYVVRLTHHRNIFVSVRVDGVNYPFATHRMEAHFPN